MKVGKKVEVLRGGPQIIIYTTNMVPVVLPANSAELVIANAVKRYEADRKRLAEKYGEL